jgi:hypothetical protein
VCGNEMRSGLVYCNAGAMPESDGGPELLAFWQVGYHSAAVDCEGSRNVDLVDSLRGGQFDLNFCSTACLRRFFTYVVDALEDSVPPTK